MSQAAGKKELRSFGLIVGGIFAALGIVPAVVRGTEPGIVPLAAAAFLVGPALLWPAMLRPVHRVWMAIGHVLGWINTRLILGAIFYLVFTPVALLWRIMGKDPMRRRFEPELPTYLLKRQLRPGTHMKRQF